jgi:hypothetical protein
MTVHFQSREAAATSSAATTYRVSPVKRNKMPNSSNHSLFPLGEFHEENLPPARTLEALPRCSLCVGGRRFEGGHGKCVFSWLSVMLDTLNLAVIPVG